MDIYLLNRVKTKKIVFTAIWHYIWPELVGIIRAKTGTFSSDYSALKSRWADAKCRWGDTDSRWRLPPVPTTI